MSQPRKIVILLCDDDPDLERGNALHREMLEGIFELQKPKIELCILACTFPDEIPEQLAISESLGGVDLALVDAHYTKNWKPNLDGVVVAHGEVDRSEEVVARFARDQRIRNLIILTGKDRDHQSQVKLIVGTGAYEYWHKQDFDTFDTLKRHLEELLDLPTRYDLSGFDYVFSRGIYAEKKFDCEAAKKEVDSVLVGESLAIRRIKRLIFEASQFDEDVPVLVTGETGTGKELVAILIHRLSKRGRVMHRDNPVTINCGLFHDDNLLRAELFGTHRGAFTGAIEREGLLEAHKGTTLFLDEVGNSLPNFQASLLRAIENREGARLGSSQSSEYKIDLRFIAATDRDVDDPKFSRPFLNRIRGLHIHIAPLRERREDIRLLAAHFLKGPVGYSPLQLTEAAMQALLSYDWPGNVRQLRHVMEIVSQRARHLRQKDRTKIDWVYRDEIEMLFSARTLSVPSSAKFDAGDMISDSPSYAEACDRFAGYYVRLRHEEIAGGERTNAAYDKTAAVLGVSRSTVKKWLQPTDPTNDS
jgi:DNA-binding NtrC family response regulator